MEFAERNGITVFGTYIDRALSAKTDNRPGKDIQPLNLFLNNTVSRARLPQFKFED